MASSAEIITAVDALTQHGYTRWTIGVAEDAIQSRSEHGNPITFRFWETENEAAAKEAQKYFLERGMKETPDSGSSAKFVYVF